MTASNMNGEVIADDACAGVGVAGSTSEVAGDGAGNAKIALHRARELMESWLGDGLVNEVSHEH